MSEATVTTAAMKPSDSRRRFSVTSFIERSAVPILLVILVVYFSNSSIGDLFTSPDNLQNIFANQSVTGLIALGMVVPLVAGYFDLSVAAVAGLSSVAFASVGDAGHPIWLAIVVALAASLIAGCITATLVALLRLNPFITTFGIYIMIGGLLQLYTGGTTLGMGLPLELSDWGTTPFLGVALPFWLLMVVALIVWYVLTQTPFGRRLTAIGSNEVAARLAGFRVSRAIFVSFLISALLGGLAGVVLVSRNLVADATTAQGYLFPALAAVFLGQTAIRPGQYNVWGTMFGVFLVAVAVNGFTLMGADSWVSNFFNGAALVVSILATTLIARYRERKARRAVVVAAQTETTQRVPIPTQTSP